MGDCLLSGQMWRTGLFCVYVTGMQDLFVKPGNLLELVLTFLNGKKTPKGKGKLTGYTATVPSVKE